MDHHPPASFVEMMMRPGMGLNTDTFSYFMHPEQAMQMITLKDLGYMICAYSPKSRALCRTGAGALEPRHYRK